MPSILEPIGAGVLVALISKYVINKKNGYVIAFVRLARQRKRKQK